MKFKRDDYVVINSPNFRNVIGKIRRYDGSNKKMYAVIPIGPDKYGDYWPIKYFREIWLKPKMDREYERNYG